MMIVTIQRIPFSPTGSLKVYDENKNLLYKVKGKFLSIRKKKKICDMNKDIIYRVQNKFFNFFSHSAYIFDANKNKIAKVNNKFFDVKNNYILEECQDEIMIEGQFFGRTSRILKNGEEIGTVTKKMGFLESQFILEANQDDIPLLVAIVVAVNNIATRKRKQTT